MYGNYSLYIYESEQDDLWDDSKENLGQSVYTAGFTDNESIDNHIPEDRIRIQEPLVDTDGITTTWKWILERTFARGEAEIELARQSTFRGSWNSPYLTIDESEKYFSYDDTATSVDPDPIDDDHSTTDALLYIMKAQQERMTETQEEFVQTLQETQEEFVQTLQETQEEFVQTLQET